MKPAFICFLCLLFLSLSRPAAWALGPIVGANAIASWKNPTTTASGTPLTNLANVKVWIGTSSHVYTKAQNAGLASSLPLSALNLTDGQYYIALQAYNSNGLASGLSGEFAFVLQTGNTTSGSTTPPPSNTNTTISNVLPRVGLPGTLVTIVGKNFLGATSVLFNGSSAKFTMVSNYVIHATVPVGATTGPVWVNTSNQAASSAFVFTLPPPVLTTFSPLQRSVGKTVTIVGKYFSGATAVTFNGRSAPFTVASNYVIHATVPAGATDGPISVTTPYGTVTSGTVFDIP
ncbi:MAG TPA: hypothetical protein VFH55_00870 [Nitrospiria bacterium]|nr:hypothetical protein [Nitrospiria bacterium]